MSEIFLTGFPGFIAGHYLPELFRTKRISIAHLLVLPRDRLLAKIKVEKLKRRFPKVDFELHEGDLRAVNLGISPLLNVESVHHLGAVYDVALRPEVAKAANLKETKNLLDWCKKLPRLKQIIYFSTCYVIGKSPHLEEAFIDHQDDVSDFLNHEEHSKWQAEQLFRDQKKCLIIRPATVVGSRSTGRTERYDGPYVLFRLIKKLRKLNLLLPNLGSPHTQANLIPVDYLCEQSMKALLQHEEQNHPLKICHMADPDPLSTHKIYRIAIKHITKKEPYVFTAFTKLIQLLLRFPFVSNLTGIQTTTLDYFLWQGTIDSPLDNFPDIQKHLSAWIDDTPA